MAIDGPRRRAYEPTQRFFDHTLAIAQLIVDLAVAERQGLLDVLDCLLMPRAWVKQDWCQGIQQTRELARRYYVSHEAMSTRLSELGLTRTTFAPQGRHRGEGRA
jgi:hypothetical protein